MASEQKSKIAVHANAIAGVAAGFCSSLTMHPLDVVTTRMQARDNRTVLAPPYRNAFDALVKIARKDGILHLYAGVVPNIVGSMTNWGVYFLGYNYARSQLRKYINSEDEHCSENEPKDLTAPMNLLCATSVGCVSAVITQPIWLAKTRMQLQDIDSMKYKSMSNCLMTVAKSEGIGALFK